jgi:hypothetical protein
MARWLPRNPLLERQCAVVAHDAALWIAGNLDDVRETADGRQTRGCLVELEELLRWWLIHHAVFHQAEVRHEEAA